MGLRFVLFTNLTVSQCMKSLHERLDAKPTKSRPALDGWIEKKGRFSVTITTPVVGRFKRTTRLNAEAARESGMTVIRGYVSDGVSPRWQRVLFGVLVVATILMVLSNQILLAVAVLVLGAAMYIPMMGDYKNSDLLLIEVEKAFKASPYPPKTKTK
jgi:hypothetical protein